MAPPSQPVSCVTLSGPWSLAHSELPTAGEGGRLRPLPQVRAPAPGERGICPVPTPIPPSAPRPSPHPRQLDPRSLWSNESLPDGPSQPPPSLPPTLTPPPPPPSPLRTPWRGTGHRGIRLWGAPLESVGQEPFLPPGPGKRQTDGRPTRGEKGLGDSSSVNTSAFFKQ